jgi:hypothetical protein
MRVNRGWYTDRAWSATVTLMTSLVGRDVPFPRQGKLNRALHFLIFWPRHGMNGNLDLAGPGHLLTINRKTV